ncbi:MAG: hydroxyacylglutathione hydrolase [Hyphomicrobiaceae bacterium]|nr:MAG: hydroxyacylglutathione hydrolase [Hyphomicrobiaceae bacterium]
MARLEIHQFICRSDNFGVLIHDHVAKVTASIDTPDADKIATEAENNGWKITHILNTHHHGDHTGGNLAMKSRCGAIVVGPRAEAAKIPGLDVAVGEGDTYRFGNFEARVLDTPGHTAGHISYWLPQAGVAFVGDTMFSLGCGRLLEGTAETMWRSLSKLMALPPETLIYCGHEYTAANARFALSIEPENEKLQARAREVGDLRAAGKPTLPVRLGLELETNPFLRPSSPMIQTRLGMAGRPLHEIFGEVRLRKDKA